MTFDLTDIKDPAEQAAVLLLLEAEERRVERLMTVAEVYEAGFKAGLSKAGLTEQADLSYQLWLLGMDEARVKARRKTPR